jgi:predicted permease
MKLPSWSLLDDLGRDVRRAIRGLRRSPGFAATVVLILALGIGANTAMFSIVYGVLLRPLPYPDARAIVRVGDSVGPSGISDMLLSNRSMPLLQENAASFEQLAAYQVVSSELNGVALSGARVSPSLFPLLRATPHLGRLFLEEEAREGADRVVLLSHAAWTSHFAANPAAVGSVVEFSGAPYLVVGVLPEGFHFPNPNSEFWMPYVIAPVTAARPPGQPGGAVFSTTVVFRVLGRLRPGVSTEQAAAEGDSILQGISSGLPTSANQSGVRVVPLLEDMVGEYRPALSILTLVTVSVLLVACLNAAGLLVARGTARRRTFAIGAALGASRGRLVRQLLTEGTVLSLGGGALGLAAATVFLRAVPALAPGDVTRLDEVGIDGTVFAFTAGLSIAVGLLCGVGPALQQSQVRLVRMLNDGSAQSVGGSGLLRTHRLRTALSTMQVAVTVVLLIGAGLLARSFVQLLTFDRGFDPANLIAATVTNPMGVAPHELSTRMPEVTASHQRLQGRLFDEVMTRLGPLPDVEAVGLSRHLPFGRNAPSDVPLRPAGTPVPSDPSEMAQTELQVVSPGYLDAMRFRVRAGRTLTPVDGSEGPRVLVANETLARALFGSGSAVGQRVIVGFGEPWEIVGVVGDIVYGGLNITGEAEPVAYFPLAQATETFFGFSSGIRVVLRTTGQSTAAIPFLREAIEAANPQATVGEVTTMEAQLLNSVAWPRLYAFFVGSLAGLALILAAVGVYGLLSYTVAQREREIGIRMALGARSSQILALVVGQGAALVGVGILIGVGAATASRRLLESYLYGIADSDLLTFLLAPLVLAAAALVACWFPARRAVRVDPVRMLRLE